MERASVIQPGRYLLYISPHKKPYPFLIFCFKTFLSFRSWVGKEHVIIGANLFSCVLFLYFSIHDARTNL